MSEIEEVVIEETEEITEEAAMTEPVVIEPVHYTYMVSIRFHNSSRAYSFGTENPDLKQGDEVVVETAQGIELGVCQNSSTATNLFPNCKMPQKPVLRLANEEDHRNYERNLELSREAFKICEDEVKDLGLSMHLLSAEYMLDRTKILFVYQAEQRVDFRELLKRLGSALHCRIELRQIGERDKAKMVGGIGMCGMECCCARFKSRMDVISINMAKTQLLALNTEKLSGVCGKLMCCLKYENDNYKALTAGLPKMGAHVEYEGQMYRVTSINVMTNEAHLENSESFETISVDDLKTKAEVRKGVTVGKKGSSRSKNTHVAPGVNKQQPVSEFKATQSEKTRAISSESKDTSHNNVQRPRRENKPAAAPAANVTTRHFSARKDNASKPAANNKPAAGNKAASGNKQNNGPRKQNTVNKNNPNVTVRSFKSSKTREEEAKGK